MDLEYANQPKPHISAPSVEIETMHKDRANLVVARGLLRNTLSLKRIKVQLREIAHIRGVPLHTLRVAEVCCGVAIYASALCGNHRVLVFDPDPDVVNHLRATFAGSHVSCELAEATTLPLPNNYIDMVILHLDDEFDRDRLLRIMREQYRVCKEAGVICTFNTDPCQLADGFWYSTLLPDALARACKHHFTNDEIFHALTFGGFTYPLTHTPKHPIIAHNYYTDPTLFFTKWFRAGDFICQWASDAELQSAFDQLTRMAEDGSLKRFMEKRELVRIPQSTLFIAYAPCYCKQDDLTNH
jgi:SAM-dependent methyltransferase